MEKEMHDSLPPVTIKSEYPPSEVYSSEPPPAYPRIQSSAVQVAKIIAATVVLMSFILGSFLLASAYITANASCKQLEQELEIFNDVADRLQSPSVPEALVQEPPQHSNENTETLHSDESSKTIRESSDKNPDSNDFGSTEETPNKLDQDDTEEEKSTPIMIKLPLQLDFDDIAGALLEKNQKSRMNCIVQKKRAEEIIDHKPRSINLPFGINLTPNLRYERLSGEKMAIFCESGNMDKEMSPDNDQEEETVMIQPVMIPTSETDLPASLVQQVHSALLQQQAESMQAPVAMQQEQNQLPSNHILHHIAQQIIAEKIMEREKAFREQNIQNQKQGQVIPLPQEILSQLNRLPNPDVVITLSRQGIDPSYQEQQQIATNARDYREMMPIEMKSDQQKLNSALEMQSENQNRLPVATFSNKIKLTPAAPESQGKNMEGDFYAKLVPVNIPMEMNPHVRSPPQSGPMEDSRPHYVHPRSIRSVEDLFTSNNKKRVKRCSCECAC